MKAHCIAELHKAAGRELSHAELTEIEDRLK